MKMQNSAETFLSAYKLCKNNLLRKEWIYALEASRSILELSKIVGSLESHSSQPFSPTHIKQLEDFLRERWERIRTTNIAYPHAANDPLNVLCITLAKVLASLVNKSVYQLLMPTVVTSDEVSLDALALQEFILSDDDTQLIEILPTLVAAETDGILKKYDEKDQTTKLLSTTEVQRFLNHSSEVKTYYNELCKVADLKNNGKSIGAYMQRLADELNDGGKRAKKGGTETKAGENAYAGIINFYDVLQTLSSEDRERIFECSAPYLTFAKNFKEIWFRVLSRAALDGKIQLQEKELADILGYLLAPESVTDQSPCVELFASNIEQILKTNRFLFEMYPKDVLPESIKIVEMKRDSAKQKLEEKLTNSPAFSENLSYPDSKVVLLKRLLSQPSISMSIDKNQLLDDSQLKYFAASKMFSLAEYEKLLSFIGAEKICGIVKNKFIFADLLSHLSLDQNRILINLLDQAHIQKIIPSSYELRIILEKFADLSTEKWIHLSHLLSMDCMQPVLSSFFTKDLSKMPALSRENLVNVMGVTRVANLLQSISPEKFNATIALFSPKQEKEIRAAYHHLLQDKISTLCQGRNKKPTYCGLFKPRIQKTLAAFALKDVLENKSDEKILSAYKKQFQRDNELGRIHRRWVSAH